MTIYYATSLHVALGVSHVMRSINVRYLLTYLLTYRRHHSTETAMLRVLSDVLTAADAQQVTLLGLLDLSAAFDCVDHQLLLQRIRRDFGFTETVLAWTTSFVTGRT